LVRIGQEIEPRSTDYEANALTRPRAGRSGPEVTNGRSGAKDGLPERLGCGTIQKEVRLNLQLMPAGAARKILLPVYST